MKLEIEIPDEKIKTLASDLMQNYPEYSQCNCLKCTSWKYDKGIYKFLDEETEKTYTVTIEQIENALPKFITGILKKKWYFTGLDINNILQFDAGDYDAYITDAIVQLAIFNDVIYG